MIETDEYDYGVYAQYIKEHSKCSVPDIQDAVLWAGSTPEDWSWEELKRKYQLSDSDREEFDKRLDDYLMNCE